MTVLSRRMALAGLALPLLWTQGAAAAETLVPGLQSLNRFLGSWTGDGEGQPGISKVSRTYEATKGGRFIVAHNTSDYAPQPKNPKGEVHTDVSWLSYDRAAKAVMFRQFHPAEGFVNTFKALSADLTGDVLVFTTVAIENIPAGYQARETYSFHGTDTFDERFEIAEPGKAFETYSLNRMRRTA